jgi:hypothetical protein
VTASSDGLVSVRDVRSQVQAKHILDIEDAAAGGRVIIELLNCRSDWTHSVY